MGGTRLSVMSVDNFSVEIPRNRAIMSDFRYPTWQRPFQEVLNEPDLEELSEKVHAAETAILLRLQELSVVAGSHDELDALRKACEELLNIQANRLKWI